MPPTRFTSPSVDDDMPAAKKQKVATTGKGPKKAAAAPKAAATDYKHQGSTVTSDATKGSDDDDRSEGNGSSVTIRSSPASSAADGEFTTNVREYFTQDLVDRLNKLNSYINAETGCATLKTVPLSIVDWGTAKVNGYRGDTWMCYNRNRLLLWALAEVSFNALTDQDGSPVNTPALRFRPFLSRNWAIAAHFMGARREPAVEDWEAETFRASKYVASDGTAKEHIKAWDHVYDATEKYQAKKAMQKIPASDLKQGDIVLVEYHVKRFMPRPSQDDAANSVEDTPPASKKDKGTARFGMKRVWDAWDVCFNLEAVSLVFPGSMYYKPPEPTSEDVEM